MPLGYARLPASPELQVSVGAVTVPRCRGIGRWGAVAVQRRFGGRPPRRDRRECHLARRLPARQARREVAAAPATCASSWPTRRGSPRSVPTRSPRARAALDAGAAQAQRESDARSSVRRSR